MKYQILQGDNRETLKTIPDNSIDAIVTDPPYGIDFLGKAWDANTGALETYQECLRVLKPGGHILAFSAARTYHHLAVTLEQAGFEIRDQIMWIYSSGFPKSQDVGRSIQRGLGVKEHYSVEEWEDKQGYSVNHPGETYGFGDPTSKDGHGDAGLSGKIAKVTDPEAKRWEGWGTALKPAHEPIALARKPMKLSIAKNVQIHGTGALNIDATRVGDEPIKTVIKRSEDNSRWYKHSKEGDNIPKVVAEEINQGRFPSNVIGEIHEPYQKYFYCPKVSRKERHMGFDTTNIPTNPDGMWDDGVQFQEKKQGVKTYKEMILDMGGMYVDKDGNEQSIDLPSKDIKLPQGYIKAHSLKDVYEQWCKDNNIKSNTGNNHPTVKPVALMEYLIKLITPQGGTVLDPFNGSGSTGMAAVGLGYNYIGCELDENYVEISKKRIDAWITKDLPKVNPKFEELFE